MGHPALGAGPPKSAPDTPESGCPLPSDFLVSTKGGLADQEHVWSTAESLSSSSEHPSMLQAGYLQDSANRGRGRGGWRWWVLAGGSVPPTELVRRALGDFLFLLPKPPFPECFLRVSGAGASRHPPREDRWSSGETRWSRPRSEDSRLAEPRQVQPSLFSPNLGTSITITWL